MFQKIALAACAALALIGTAHAQNVNAQTGTAYTVLNTDCDPAGAKLLTFNNAAAVAVTLPQAGASGLFLSACRINIQNIGLGTVTITPTTSTINGATTMAVASFGSTTIFSDGTAAATGNYWTVSGAAGPNGAPATFGRNVIQNGDAVVAQRGTGTQTCAAAAGLVAANYSADRWGCSANVTSGVGRAKVVSTGLPAGTRGAVNMWRLSGALTQPVCSLQEIETKDIAALAGGPVTLSFQAKADSGLSADNGNVINAFIFTGTGSDEGLGTMTASPAITPAWTGIASSITKAYTLTTSYARYTLNASLASTVTEAAVVLCFTPTATGAGATDGFFFTGVQLEAGTVATAYEVKSAAIEAQTALRYYWQLADGAATVYYPSSCSVITANTTVKCQLTLPAIMRAVPTSVVGTATSFGIQVTAGTAGTCSTLAVTASSNTTQAIGLTCTTGGTIALGSGTTLIGGASAGILTISADF